MLSGTNCTGQAEWGKVSATLEKLGGTEHYAEQGATLDKWSVSWTGCYAGQTECDVGQTECTARLSALLDRQ